VNTPGSWREVEAFGVADCETLGVIDIGSNSGRVLVARVTSAAHLDILGDARSALRLVRDVAKRGALSEETIQRTLSIVRGFVAVSLGAGAQRTMAVATAAVREATNGEALLERVRSELGVPVEVADGEQEAQFGFLGAVHGLPVEHGIVLDVGGGRLQLVHFRDRRPLRTWSLKLGALRVSDRFLKADPPSRGEVRALKRHVYEILEAAGVTPLRPDERLVATGGSVRNLAKVDRRLLGDYPISRLHGYVLDRRRLDEVGATLTSVGTAERGRVPGLNGDRADSIVGGLLVVQSVMDRLLAAELTVAGYGLREGIALHSMTSVPAAVAEVQRAAILALGQRFGSWERERAARRAGLVERILAVTRVQLSSEALQAASVAAWLLDVGASIDYYRRHAHSARIIADANIDGYSHRTLALAAAAVLGVGEREASARSFAPVLSGLDTPVLEQLAAAVGLADVLVRYGNADADQTRVERSDGHVALDLPVADTWPLAQAIRRAERAFGITVALRSRTAAGQR
jgi:exopolyphosphatase/guanosine-5'-triphosphate,3'-diphosphate pyrophosphatase